MDLSSPAFDKIVEVLFEKIFSNVKDLASYHIDKFNYSNMCAEAYNSLHNLDLVKTINDFDQSVSLYDFYVAPQVTAINSPDSSFLVENLKDFSCSKKILISGIVGQGKSILMRHLAIQEAYKGERFPIFTELRELEENESLEKFIRRNIKSWLKLDNEKVISYLLKEGKIIFFFDGFDEVRINNMGKIVKDFEKLCRTYPKLNFIVSSRPEDTIDKSTIFNKFLINKLDLSGQLKIIDKLVVDKLMKINLTKNLEKPSNNIQSVLVTPLMVNFYYYLYKSEQIVSDNVKLFYDKLFDLTQRKHDGTKLLYTREYSSNLSPDEIESAFECICYLSCHLETFFITEYKFREIIEKSIKFNNLQCSVDQLLKDFTTGVCFICREGQSYAFLHTSIAEFFAAKFISKNHEVEGIFDDLINNYTKYLNVVNYLKIVNEKYFYTKFLNKVINGSISFFKSKNVFDSIYISSIKYNKNYSQSDAMKNLDNRMSALIIYDNNVHPYIAFEFMNYIEPIIRNDLKKKFIFLTGLEMEVLYNSLSIVDDENKPDINKSNNYYLYEKIEDKSERGTRSKVEIDRKLKDQKFFSIQSNYSPYLSNIIQKTNLYTSKLEKDLEKIQYMAKQKNINQLF